MIKIIIAVAITFAVTIALWFIVFWPELIQVNKYEDLEITLKELIDGN